MPKKEDEEMNLSSCENKTSNGLTCEDLFNCCDCGGSECGCGYCWSCNACDHCK